MDDKPLQCTLCHLKFRPETRFHGADEVYAMYCEERRYNYFHVSCFGETLQGRMGYKPTFRFFYFEGVEASLEKPKSDFITQRFNKVE